VKNIPSTLKKLRNYVWRKGGDSHHDYISTYSAMHGEPRYKNEQHERAMTAPIDDGGDLEKRVRRAGL